MFETVKYCYTVYKLISYIQYIEGLSDTIDEKKLIDDLIIMKSYINYLGFIGIKFTQWYITRLMSLNTRKNNIITKYFNDLFENCPQHSLEFTKKLFKEKIGFELEEYIEIDTLKVKASGSIGQIYYAKIKDSPKENPIEVAIKVKHPNINNDLERLNNFIYVIDFIKSISFYKHRYKLYFDYEDFKDHLVKQIDFKKEAENCKRFQDLYQNNDYIVFPKIYQYNEDIIISKYEDGIDFRELSLYQKSKCAVNFLCFILSSVLITNFIHGDLHIKNWKLQLMDNGIDYKLIIYDHGICFSTDSVENNRLFWSAFENNNKEQVVSFFESNATPKLNDKVKNKLYDLYDKFCEEKQTIYILCKNVFDSFMLQDDIKLNKNILNLTIFINLVEDIIMKEICIGNTSDYNIIASVCNIYTTIIAYCSSNNIYPELKKYLENEIKKKSDLNLIKGKDLFINNSNLIFASPEL